MMARWTLVQSLLGVRRLLVSFDRYRRGRALQKRMQYAANSLRIFLKGTKGYYYLEKDCLYPVDESHQLAIFFNPEPLHSYPEETKREIQALKVLIQKISDIVDTDRTTITPFITEIPPILSSWAQILREYQRIWVLRDRARDPELEQDAATKAEEAIRLMRQTADRLLAVFQKNFASNAVQAAKSTATGLVRWSEVVSMSLKSGIEAMDEIERVEKRLAAPSEPLVIAEARQIEQICLA